MTQTDRPRHGLRGSGAVLAGLVTIIVTSMLTDAVMHGTGVFPPAGQPMAGGLFLLALAYRTVYGVAGSYVTARLAPSRPLKHALILGTIGTVVGLAASIATWKLGPEFGPKWYALAVAAIGLPCAWLGARLAGGDR
jgi:hypothetical protein